MRLATAALASVLLCPAAFAIAPEDTYQAELDKEAVAFNTACGNSARVVLDIASWDNDAIAHHFSPTVQCTEAVKAFAASCTRAPNLYGDKVMAGTHAPIDVTPLLELTELRCTLDTKHEGIIRDWLKARPRRKRSDGDDAFSKFIQTEAFKDLPSVNNSSIPAGFGQAVTTFSGTRMTVAYTAESSNLADVLSLALLTESKARGGKPAYGAHRKALEETFRARVGKDNDSTWKVLQEGNKEKVRECDDQLAEAVKKTAAACDVTIPATIEWGTVEAPVTEDVDLCRSVGSTCSVTRDLEFFTGACLGVLEGIADTCKDDALQALVVKKLKCVSCRFERTANKGKKGTDKDGSFPLELKNGVLSARWAWDSSNHSPRTFAWLKNNL